MTTIRIAVCAAAALAGALTINALSVAAQRPDTTSAAGPSPDRAQQTKRVTSEQRENVAARVATATAIVDRLEADAKRRGLASGWRRASLESLLPLSLDALQQVEQRAVTADSLAVVAAAAADDPSVLGDPNEDLVYTPITPCRFIDTRNVGGKINGTRPFSLHLTGAAFGGSAACEMPALFSVGPDNFGALAMNVTVVDTSASGAPGFLAVKPTEAAPNTSLLNWYDAGASVQVANQGIIATHQDPSNLAEFVIVTSGAVHVIVDIFGAFIPPQATALSIELATNSNVSIANNQSFTALSDVCPSGYVATGGSCSTGAIGMELRNSARFGNSWLCTYRNLSGATATFTVEAICARVPGR